MQKKHLGVSKLVKVESDKQNVKVFWQWILAACETYVANVWPVASVRSQNAVQHIVIRSALAMSRDTM